MIVQPVKKLRAPIARIHRCSRCAATRSGTKYKIKDADVENHVMIRMGIPSPSGLLLVIAFVTATSTANPANQARTLRTLGGRLRAMISMVLFFHFLGLGLG